MLRRILFWNINKKPLLEHLCALATDTQADLIVLCEPPSPARDALDALRTAVSAKFYCPASGDSSGDRFSCYCRDTTLDASEIHNGNRGSFRRLELRSTSIVLGLVHGPDPRNNDIEIRSFWANRLARELQFVKEHHRTDRIVLLGDFNMNPYDRAMNLAGGLNAMMTKQCVAPGVRIHQDQEYDLYYNPMWGLFGDGTDGPAGTVHDTSNQGPYGWSMFDQVLFASSVVDVYQSVEILTEAGAESLLDKKGRPSRRQGSDHLPLLVTLKEDCDV